MEMDFLGVHSPPPARGAGDGVMQSPYRSMPSPRQFVPFMPPHCDEQAKFAVPRLASSLHPHAVSFDVLGAHQKSSPAPMLQKSLNLSKLAGQLRAVRVPLSQVRSPFGASSDHPRNTTNRMFQCVMSGSCLYIQDSGIVKNVALAPSKQPPREGTTVAVHPSAMFASRSTVAQRYSTAQLTILYAGSVNAFDNVSMETAEQIMSLAAKASQEGSLAICPPMPQSESSALKPMTNVVSSNAPQSARQMTVQKQAHVNVANSAHPSSGNEHTIRKTNAPCSPKEQLQPLTTPFAMAIMPRAVPQARKASLARFLERRKERVANAMPYPSGEKSPGPVVTSPTSSSKSKNPFSSREVPWIFGEAKSITAGYSKESPSTQLKI